MCMRQRLWVLAQVLLVCFKNWYSFSIHYSPVLVESKTANNSLFVLHIQSIRASMELYICIFSKYTLLFLTDDFSWHLFIYIKNVLTLIFICAYKYNMYLVAYILVNKNLKNILS